MGTTRAFIFVKNNGLGPEELRNTLISLFGQSKNNQKEQLLWEKWNRLQPAATLNTLQKDAIGMLFAMQNQTKAALHYSETAKWLPLFEEQLCDGNNVRSEELRELSKQFQAPVFAFSIFDSDVLMLSYCDEEKNRMYDHEKHNDKQSEEYCGAGFCKDFPLYLLDFCEEKDWDRMKEIWESEDEDFADDRMEKIADLSGMNTVYDFDSEIPGFRKLTAADSIEEIVP